ncbi:MAG: hydantoinase/oxoprolinase family protein [Burkholderiaceae bacterium]|nr:hydantoinase/oxoprolinase family protein [Burkholderiaceae bacterium]
MPTQPPDPLIVGWDIGGAHLKACVTRGGEVVDVAQWACPLWQGLDQLDRVLQRAHARWPMLQDAPGRVAHAVTMSGEMVDAFAHREDGVQRIATRLAQTLHGAVRLYAGDLGWIAPADATRHWERIASANWLATAQHAAAVFGDGVLIDVGSTTTDLIAFAGGRVLTASRSDHDRLASGELIYQGVVRTPLCALARRIMFRGRSLNVMNEWFATTADVYRLTGELDPTHDQQPSADGQPKDRVATQQRLARMVGLDARDASDEAWQGFAQAWRDEQVNEIAGQLARVVDADAALPAATGAEAHPRFSSTAAAATPPAGTIVTAGCGAFLVAAVAARVAALAGWPCRAYGSEVARIAITDGRTSSDDKVAWAQVCAPSIAVASLLARERG